MGDLRRPSVRIQVRLVADLYATCLFVKGEGQHVFQRRPGDKEGQHHRGQ